MSPAPALGISAWGAGSLGLLPDPWKEGPAAAFASCCVAGDGDPLQPANTGWRAWSAASRSDVTLQPRPSLRFPRGGCQDVGCVCVWGVFPLPPLAPSRRRPERCGAVPLQAHPGRLFLSLRALQPGGAAGRASSGSSQAGQRSEAARLWLQRRRPTCQPRFLLGARRGGGPDHHPPHCAATPERRLGKDGPRGGGCALRKVSALPAEL